MNIKNHKWLVFLVVSAMFLEMLPVSLAAEQNDKSQTIYPIKCENKNVVLKIDDKVPDEESMGASEGVGVVIAPKEGYVITETPVVEKIEAESPDIETSKVESETVDTVITGGAEDVVESTEPETDKGVEVRNLEDGTYEFTMPASGVTISVKTEAKQKPTPTPTSTPVESQEPTATPVIEPSQTPSTTPPEQTESPTPTNTPEVTPTPTVSPTETPTERPSETPFVTATPPVPDTPPVETPDIGQSPTPLPVVSETPVPPAIWIPAQPPEIKSELVVKQKNITLFAFCNVKSKPKKGIYVPSLKMTDKLTTSYDAKKFTVTYISSNTKVVSVDKSGTLKAGRMGKANVVVRLHKKGSKVIEESQIISVLVKPVIYLKHLTGKKYIVSKGKRFTKKKGVRFYVAGTDKPFYLFYRSGNKKYSIYLNKKWKKNVKSIPKEKKTWVPLSGKKYSFYISTDKKGKEKGTGSSNVIVWKS